MQYETKLLISTLFFMSLVLLLAGCNEIEPIEIEKANAMFYQKNNSAVSQQSKAIPLSPDRMQFVQGWLNANRTGWESHKSMATLWPLWCMELTSRNEKPIGFCRYGGKVVLRGYAIEVEKPLSEQDKSLFLRHIEK